MADVTTDTSKEMEALKEAAEWLEQDDATAWGEHEWRLFNVVEAAETLAAERDALKAEVKRGAGMTDTSREADPFEYHDLSDADLSLRLTCAARVSSAPSDDCKLMDAAGNRLEDLADQLDDMKAERDIARAHVHRLSHAGDQFAAFAFILPTNTDDKARFMSEWKTWQKAVERALRAVTRKSNDDLTS